MILKGINIRVTSKVRVSVRVTEVLLTVHGP
jgi:hypothetical protein